jgi:hypothetical protein
MGCVTIMDMGHVTLLDMDCATVMDMGYVTVNGHGLCIYCSGSVEQE